MFRESILEDYHDGQILFNKTSGLINSHATNKNLVYNIFDIVDDKLSYKERRDMLNKIHPTSNTIRILPVLYVGRDKNRINEGRTSRKRFVCPICIIFENIYAIQLHHPLDKLHILCYTICSVPYKKNG